MKQGMSYICVCFTCPALAALGTPQISALHNDVYLILSSRYELQAIQGIVRLFLSHSGVEEHHGVIEEQDTVVLPVSSRGRPVHCEGLHPNLVVGNQIPHFFWN